MSKTLRNPSLLASNKRYVEENSIGKHQNEANTNNDRWLDIFNDSIAFLVRVTEDINDAKKLLNFQIELPVKYFQEKYLWSSSTIRSYARIITDYMTFSSTIDPTEYIIQRFLQNKSSTTWRSKLNETLWNYPVWICKF